MIEFTKRDIRWFILLRREHNRALDYYLTQCVWSHNDLDIVVVWFSWN